MQPLQRSYEITEESIEEMLNAGTLKALWDDVKAAEYEEMGTTISAKDKKKYDAMLETKPLYEKTVEALKDSVSDDIWMSPGEFLPVITEILNPVGLDKKMIAKVMDGLSKMNKEAEIQRDKKGNILYDKSTKDSEIVKFEEDIDTYMQREVLPHVPDAVAFWEEDLTAKNPVVKTGAEIPFTRYFYKYQAPVPSEELEKKFIELENSVSERIKKLFS